ncbi:hypothetical protein LCGC14_2807880 [marine sediment metagenome]|uniref:Uncharacterized protein n=1 Tax=marine sediment metagenome TaxID=412755 RepID=A0A0F8Z7L7_9ZZZZ
MDKTLGRVIKKASVRMVEGRRCIGEPTRQEQTPCEQTARILEQTETRTLIEVTCSCGEKIRVECDAAADADVA